MLPRCRDSLSLSHLYSFYLPRSQQHCIWLITPPIYQTTHSLLRLYPHGHHIRLEMSDISKSASPTPPPTHSDLEAPPQSSKNEPSRRTLPWLIGVICRSLSLLATLLYKCLIGAVLGVAKWSAKVARRHLFISAIFLYGILIALVAIATMRYYNKDMRSGYQDIPDNPSGVCLPWCHWHG